MTDLLWTNCTVKLGELKPWAHNPRLSTKAQAKRIIKSFDKFGQVQTVSIGPGNEVYDGHQRLSALLTVEGADYVIDARRSNRALTEDERKELVVTLHVGAVGSWDWQAVSGWEADKLQAWGMDADALKAWNNDANNLKELLAAEVIDGNDDKYTSKVETPIYEIKGEKPTEDELFDSRRYKELLSEIDSSNLPEKIKEFLRVASTRHIIFDFSKIAEYYAHADALTQKLMENNALVIVDFERAIELGYVRLAEKISEQFLREYPNE